jgi:phage shock protein A
VSWTVRHDLEKFSNIYDKIESRIFEIEQRVDAVDGENAQLRSENAELRERVSKTQREFNDLEQYGRRWNLRVFGIAEQAKQDVVTKMW